MEVQVTHHIDASEPNAEGRLDFRYEYDLYMFSENGVTVVARSYAGESEAYLLRIEVSGEPRLIARADLDTSLVSLAVQYLRVAGKREINWLSGRGNGYEPLVLAT